jgi:hypothetical protein
VVLKKKEGGFCFRDNVLVCLNNYWEECNQREKGEKDDGMGLEEAKGGGVVWLRG